MKKDTTDEPTTGEDVAKDSEQQEQQQMKFGETQNVSGETSSGKPNTACRIGDGVTTRSSKSKDISVLDPSPPGTKTLINALKKLTGGNEMAESLVDRMTKTNNNNNNKN